MASSCTGSLLQQLDERIPVKRLIRQWRTRVELLVRLLTLSTFFDDVFRVVTHFGEHAEQVRHMPNGALARLKDAHVSFGRIQAVGYLGPLLETSWPQLSRCIATVLMASGLLVQVAGESRPCPGSSPVRPAPTSHGSCRQAASTAQHLDTSSHRTRVRRSLAAHCKLYGRAWVAATCRRSVRRPMSQRAVTMLRAVIRQLEQR